MPTWDQILGFLTWLGPVGAVLALVCGAQFYALYRVFKFFAERDREKREDLQGIFKRMDRFVNAIHGLTLTMGTRGYNVTSPDLTSERATKSGE